MRFIFLFLVGITTVSAAEFHKWVDKDGVTHFTRDLPPPNDSEVIRPRVGEAFDPDVVQKQINEAKRNAEKITREGPPKQSFRREATAKSQRCEKARARVERLRSEDIMVKNAEGEQRLMSSEERDRLVQQGEAEVGKECK
ncbi:hypothetical protein CCP3SC1AL1_4340001 [Gammaproteobacteria bacterium]